MSALPLQGAYGDQCEKCGTSLSPADLINPKSAISGSKPVMKETKHWYLPLDKHEGWFAPMDLEDHKEWRPNVYGQCKAGSTWAYSPCGEKPTLIGESCTGWKAEESTLCMVRCTHRIYFKYQRATA